MFNDDSLEIYLHGILYGKIAHYYKKLESSENRIGIANLEKKHLAALNNGLIYEDPLLKFYKDDDKILIAIQEKLFRKEKNKVVNQFGPILFEKNFYDSLLNREDSIWGVISMVSLPRQVIEYVPKQKILERFHHYDGKITKKDMKNKSI